MARSLAKSLRRRGFAYRGPVIGLSAFALIGVPAFWAVSTWIGASQDAQAPVTCEVLLGDFVHDISERGNVESASNVEISSKVESNNSGGTTILWIIDEGTVIEPEDCLPERMELPYELVEKYMALREAEKAGRSLDSSAARQPEIPQPVAGTEQPTGPAGTTPPTTTPPTTTPPTTTPPTITPPATPPATATPGTIPAATTPPAVTPPALTPPALTPPATAPPVAAPTAETPPSGLAATAPVAAGDLTGEGGTSAEAPAEEFPITLEELREKMLLVQLDSSALENQLIQQEIIVQNSAAAVIQAKNSVTTAEIAKKEYLQGTYEKSVLAKGIEIDEAKVAISRAGNIVTFSEKLYRKGYVTKQQLQDHRTDLKKAENQLILLETELRVLNEFTLAKELGDLEAAIAVAEAKRTAEQRSHELDVEQLADIKQQIINCWIFARNPGQVVYANSEGHRGHGEVVIEEGTSIREGQTIIRLPDPTQMQVDADISEGKISLVKVGMKATIRLDAFADQQLGGVVKEVSEYPEGGGWWSGGQAKKYETLVRIVDPSVELRAGLTAEVRIRVQHLHNVLMVPVQAVVECDKTHYCILLDGGDFVAHEVQIGPTNDEHIVIEGGLEAGTEIVQNTNKFREDAGLKASSEEEEEEGEEPDAEKSQGPGGGPGVGGPGGRGPGAGGPGAGGPGAGGPGGGGPGGGPPTGKGPGAGKADPAAIAAGILKNMDKNKDGSLQKDELPGQMWSQFSKADTNGDDTISRQELTAAMRARMAAGGGGRKPGATP